MTLVTDLDEFKTPIHPSPEALYPNGTFNPISQVIPPCALNADSHVVPIPVTHDFECEKRFWCFDEDFSNTHLELFRGYVRVFEDLLGTALVITSPRILASI